MPSKVSLRIEWHRTPAAPARRFSGLPPPEPAGRLRQASPSPAGCRSLECGGTAGTFAPGARNQYGLTREMFVSEERLLAVDFQDASSRLGLLARGGGLRALSETVYNDGVEYLLRVGPLGAVPGASRLVRVRFTESAAVRGPCR